MSVFFIPEEPENVQKRSSYLCLYSLYRKSLKIFMKNPLTYSVFSIPEEPENVEERSSYLGCILYTGRA
jgi:hypothetical protein